MNNEEYRKRLRKVRAPLALFIVGTVLSGLTALPLETEIDFLYRLVRSLQSDSSISTWIANIHEGLHQTNSKYPFIMYGTDWLAFAHVIIAAFFIRPYINPIRDGWVIDFGIVACIAVFPVAFVAGTIRGIPFFWQLIDCSFGLVGGLLLLYCKRVIAHLKKP